MDSDRITHKPFLWDLNLCKHGNWIFKIKASVNDIDKTGLHNNSESFDLKATLKNADIVFAFGRFATAYTYLCTSFSSDDLVWQNNLESRR